MESFWLCDDCLFAAAYEDYSTMPISADFDPETGRGIRTFSPLPCDGCDSPLHGQRHRFTRL
ncbi:hypothetical protein [Pseudomonas sp. OVF7]|uniref:hypothetical protein n=1 Tax=unclassified Pseudomonas TaxID=196821 RepID=UPI00272C7E35|nr:hypothetical protein [Pseudomonas sp. OVF7]WLD65564.1 hypothetical protein QU606_24860 [Pseudomonas sp. OVF7]